MKNKAMIDALRKRRGRGLDISIIIGPEKEVEEPKKVENEMMPEDGLAPDIKEKNEEPEEPGEMEVELEMEKPRSIKDRVMRKLKK